VKNSYAMTAGHCHNLYSGTTGLSVYDAAQALAYPIPTRFYNHIRGVVNWELTILRVWPWNLFMSCWYYRTADTVSFFTKFSYNSTLGQ